MARGEIPQRQNPEEIGHTSAPLENGQELLRPRQRRLGEELSSPLEQAWSGPERRSPNATVPLVRRSVDRRRDSDQVIHSHPFFEGAVEFIESEREWGITLPKKIGRAILRLVDHIPFVEKGRKKIGEKIAEAHDGYLEKLADKLVEDPDKRLNPITRSIIMRQAFQEALPTRIERLKESHPKVAKWIKWGKFGIELVSMTPLLTLPTPITNPILHILLRNVKPITLVIPHFRTFILSSSVPIFANQLVTFIAVNGARVIRDGSHFNPIGFFTYLGFTVADLILPVFNSLVPGIGMDELISHHYKKRGDLYFKKLQGKVGMDRDRRGVAQTELLRMAQAYASHMGVKKEDQSLKRLKEFLTEEQKSLARPIPEPKYNVKNPNRRWHIGYYLTFSPGRNNLIEHEYKHDDSRRKERFDAAARILQHLSVVDPNLQIAQ